MSDGWKTKTEDDLFAAEPEEPREYYDLPQSVQAQRSGSYKGNDPERYPIIEDVAAGYNFGSDNWLLSRGGRPETGHYEPGDTGLPKGRPDYYEEQLRKLMFAPQQSTVATGDGDDKKAELQKWEAGNPVEAYVRRHMESSRFAYNHDWWAAAEDYVRHKDTTGIRAGADNYGTLTSAMKRRFRDMQEYHNKNPDVEISKEMVAHALRMSLSDAWKAAETGYDALAADLEEHQPASVRHLLTKKGHREALMRGSSKGTKLFNPDPAYTMAGNEWHSWKAALYNDTYASLRQSNGPEDTWHVNTKKFFSTLDAFRHRTWSDAFGEDVAARVGEGESFGSVAKSLGLKKSEVEKKLDKHAAGNIASFIMTQKERAVGNLGVYQRNVDQVERFISSVDEYVGFNRDQDIHRALEIQDDDYRRLTNFLGGTVTPTAEFQKIVQDVADASNNPQLKNKLYNALKTNDSEALAPLRLEVQEIMAARIKAMGEGASKEFHAEDMTNILFRSVTGRVLIDGDNVSVAEEMGKYRVALDAPRLMSFATTMAYRAMMENPALVQMYARDYDERNPEDVAIQKTLGHRLSYAALNATLAILDDFQHGSVTALKGGQIRKRFDWEALGAKYMAFYGSHQKGYGNNLMRLFFKEIEKPKKNQRVGQIDLGSPRKMTLPEYDMRPPTQPSVYGE